MTNCTHHTNQNNETLKGACGNGLCTSGVSSNSATSSSAKSKVHCAHMSKTGKPIEEEVVEVKEEWDY